MLETEKTKTTASITGALIEHKASLWLQDQGLTLVEKNYRCRVGEIDIIMRDGLDLVFVEVRFRRHNSYGNGLESVDWRKQQRLQKAAAHYLLHRSHLNNLPCRFDVLAAQPNSKTTLRWSWIKNAFSA